MNRRTALLAFGCGLALPLAYAQQRERVWRIGVLTLRPIAAGDPDLGAFPRQMRALGYVEGQNVRFDWRTADGKYERLPALASELAALRPDVIVAAGTPATAAAQKATRSIPIVMTVVTDPVGSGFVGSLARPAGNITGVSNMTGDLGAKQLELLRTVAPALSRVAVLLNPTNAGQPFILTDIEAAARKHGIQLQRVVAKAPAEIEQGFAALKAQRANAVIVLADGFFISQRDLIAKQALEHRVPVIFTTREHVQAGGLMSYGPSFADLYARAAVYVDRILKGAKPAELPVEQPTKLELIINVRAAKAIGIAIPSDLLLRADEVLGR